MPAEIDPQPALDDRGLPHGYPLNPDWEITPRQLRDAMESDDPPVLVDCRTHEELAIARFDAALHLPLQEAGERLEELRPHADQPIAVICHHGVRSLRLAALLRQAGFARPLSLAGGIDLWSIDIDLSMPRY